MNAKALHNRKPRKLKRVLSNHGAVYVMAFIPLLYFVVFHYLPMPGIIIAFREFNPLKGLKGLFTGEWLGLTYFRQIFGSVYFSRTIVNTLRISGLKILFGFPAPIIFALMIDQLTGLKFKKTIQTVSYFPHFLSWVIVASLIQMLFSPTIGIVNQIRETIGLNKVSYLMQPKAFLSILVLSDIWKEIGWGSIIYLSAIAGVDPNLYEAAGMDGASRLQKVWHITLPGITSVIGVMLILRVGAIMNAGFDQVFLLMTTPVQSVADIIDTYVFREGISGMKYGFSTAVNLFKSMIGLVLILASNAFARKYEAGLW